jgi:hypothetical protein
MPSYRTTSRLHRRDVMGVVDDPSHTNLQQLGAGRQITPVRFDKIRRTSTPRAAETCAPRGPQITSVRRHLPCHCCLLSGRAFEAMSGPATHFRRPRTAYQAGCLPDQVHCGLACIALARPQKGAVISFGLRLHGRNGGNDDMEGAACGSYVLAGWRVSFGARPSSVELHRSAPRLTDVRRIAYEPPGRNGSVDFVCRRSRRDAS